MEPSKYNYLALIPPEQLPALSEVLEKARAIAADPDATLAQLAWTISADKALLGILLKFAQSPYYRRRVKVSEAKIALELIGPRTAMDLLAAANIRFAFQGFTSRHVSLRDFVDYGLGVGATLGAIKQHTQTTPAVNPLALGVLHNVGELAMLYKLGDVYIDDVVLKASNLKLSRYKIEQRAYGTDHYEQTAAMLRHWKLPEVFAQAAYQIPESRGAGNSEAVQLRQSIILTRQHWDLCPGFWRAEKSEFGDDVLETLDDLIEPILETARETRDYLLQIAF
jgi:HD-like signal output (HDOD) protein